MTKLYHLMSKKELIKICKNEGITGYSKLKKMELVKKVSNYFKKIENKSYYEDENIFCHPNLIDIIMSYASNGVEEHRRNIFKKEFEKDKILLERGLEIINIGKIMNPDLKYLNFMEEYLTYNYYTKNCFGLYENAIRAHLQYSDELISIIKKRSNMSFYTSKHINRFNKSQLLRIKEKYLIDEITKTMSTDQMRKIYNKIYNEIKN